MNPGGQTPPERGIPTGDDSLHRIRTQQMQVNVQLQTVRPVATYLFLGITILVYLLQVWSISATGIDLPYQLGAKLNDVIYRGQVWRLVTPVFLHGSLIHIGINAWVIYLLGRGLEPYYGHIRFVLLYFISAFAGNTVSFLILPSASIGAATALFGLLAAQGVFVLQNRAVIGDRARSMLIQIAVVIALNLGIGFIPGFDSWGSLGGLLGGLAFAWFAGPVWGVRANLSQLEIIDIRDVHLSKRVFGMEAVVISALVAQRMLLQ